MYVPKHFEISDAEEVFAFLDANAFGQLISRQDGEIMASHLPFLLAADRQHLHCHLARQNPQWQQLEGQRVLITFQGAHDYISPNWYETAGVPTWNYQAVHIYGYCRVFDDASELSAVIEALSNRHESGFETPWQPKYPDTMLKAIVGVEIIIDEVQCKYKLSQNRPAADQRSVVERLDQLGSKTLAGVMRKTLF